MADLDVYKTVVIAYNMLSPSQASQPVGVMTKPAMHMHSERGINRCGTMVDLEVGVENVDELQDGDPDVKMNEKESNQLQDPEYGFGCPFSYWEEYTYYEYVCAKYSNLKDELLNNEIEKVSITDWNDISSKAQQLFDKIETILGQRDKNTAFAHNDKQWNEIMKIEAAQKISLSHLLSIIFYTDLNELPCKMKNVCRKLHRNESKEAVKKRHSELTNWLRLLFETIVLYGNKLSIDELLYHGLDKKFFFKEFKAKFFIPTSTTKERSIAMNFAKGTGVVLEFGGIETVGDPYFETDSLSHFPDERECLFFFADIPIKSVWMNSEKLDMSSLSLYQSIMNGNIIIDKARSDKKQFQKTQKKLRTLLEELAIEMEENKEIENAESNDAKQFGKDLLKRFVKETDRIWINADEIISKITLPPLRQMFIEQNGDKSFARYSEHWTTLQKQNKITIDTAKKFKWEIESEEINAFLSDSEAIASQSFKCPNKSKFHCQMNKRGGAEEDLGRISLFSYKIPKAMSGEVTISFDLYCKKMKDFYCRFHQIKLKKGEGQGIDFELDWLRNSKAVKKKKSIEWEISIRTHSNE